MYTRAKVFSCFDPTFLKVLTGMVPVTWKISLHFVQSIIILETLSMRKIRLRASAPFSLHLCIHSQPHLEYFTMSFKSNHTTSITTSIKHKDVSALSSTITKDHFKVYVCSNCLLSCSGNLLRLHRLHCVF